MIPKYYAFPTTTVGGDLVIGHEKVKDIVEEVRPLLMDHYEETETAYLDVPCDPDFDRFIASEEQGQFVVFTARKAGVLIGHISFYVYRDMHSQEMYQAREDAMFIDKEHRGGATASRLVNYAEHCLAQLGCKYIGMSSKAPCGGPDIGRFLERKGYQPVALFYSKQLESDSHGIMQRSASGT